MRLIRHRAAAASRVVLVVLLGALAATGVAPTGSGAATGARVGVSEPIALAAGAVTPPGAGRLLGPASAASGRDYVLPPPRGRGLAAPLAARPGDSLPASASSANFKVHYDPANNSAADASAVLSEAETGYAKLVLGAGGSPNAGLRAPLRDGSQGGDSRLDVYLKPLDFCPPWASACAIGEWNGSGVSGFIEIGPQYATGGGPVVHEFTHLVQFAYGGSALMEAGANWGQFWADRSAFTLPIQGWSLDCANTTEIYCPYDQWRFVERQVQDYGVAFVDTLFKQGGSDREGARDAIAAASGGSDDLSEKYSAYARQLWDPTTWADPLFVPPLYLANQMFPFVDEYTAVEVGRSAADTGERVTGDVDHLSSRPVRITSSLAGPTAPGDRLRVSVRDPATPGILRPTTLLVGGAGGHRTEVPLSATCGSFRCAMISFDQASVSDVVIPLVNDNDPLAADTAPYDDLSFTWRVELLPAAATPPANDARAGAAPIGVGQTLATDNAYASGTGVSEVPECPPVNYWGWGDTNRGVWYRFQPPHEGTYTFDASGSDFPAAIAIVRADGALQGCDQPFYDQPSGHSAHQVTGSGDAYYIYVARAPGEPNLGHTARLRVVEGALLLYNTVPPTISGNPEVGQQLTCSSGSWHGDQPISFYYLWVYENGSVASYGSANHTVTEADRGRSLRCQVLAGNHAAAEYGYSDWMQIASAPVTPPQTPQSLPSASQPNPLCSTLRKKLRKAKRAHNTVKVRKLRNKLRRLGC